MEFKLPYGKKQINLEIPDKNLIPVLYKQKDASNLNDETDIISYALKNPISSPPLADLASKKKNVCILVSDITRPCPSYKFLPFIIEQLKRAGAGRIKIVFGLGIHRPHTEEEKLKLAGKTAAESCELIDSDQSRCRFAGNTSFGTPIEVFEDVLDSDFLIATGNIEYHYFAGYSGGTKALMLGVCSRKSVSANHSMMLEDKAAAGRFFDNPVRQDIEEAGRLVPIDFIFNVILDDEKKIIGAVSGKNNKAYLEGIKLYDSIYEIGIREHADIVITSPGGYPKNINLYQAQKALDNVKDIVKQGGKIILAAECPEEFGEDVFEQWMADVRDYEKLYGKIRKQFVLGGHKAVAISKLMTKADIYAYDDDSKGKACKAGFENINDIQAFINSEIAKDKNIKIAVVPNGRFVKILK